MVIPSTEESNLSTKLIFCIIKDEQRLVSYNYILFINSHYRMEQNHTAKLPWMAEWTKLKMQKWEIHVRTRLGSTQWSVKVASDIRRLSFLSLAGFSCSSTVSNQGVSASKFLTSKSLFWSPLPSLRVGRYFSVTCFHNRRIMSDATLTLQCVEPRRFQT